MQTPIIKNSRDGNVGALGTENANSHAKARPSRDDTRAFLIPKINKRSRYGFSADGGPQVTNDSLFQRVICLVDLAAEGMRSFGKSHTDKALDCVTLFVG